VSSSEPAGERQPFLFGDVVRDWPAAAERESVPVLLEVALRLAAGVQDASQLQRLVDAVTQLVEANEGLLARQLLVAVIGRLIHSPPL
jgi:hypothetical protein